MGAARYDLYIEQGATFEKVITWKDSSGNAISLTGYTVDMNIRETYDSTTVIAEYGGTPLINIVLGGTAGTISITISDTVTADFTFESAVYDLKLTETSSGKVTRLLEGEVFLSKRVTQ